jgi:asparagine synthase (glutamine-hydrolysing)
MTELHESAGPGPGEAVFPDRAAAAAVARSFARPGSRTLAHTSGRPWLVGRWHDQEVLTADTGSARVAVVGCCPIEADDLRRRLVPR